VGALPDRLRRPLLAPPDVARAVSRAVSSVHADDAIRVLSVYDALKEAPDARFAA
jgi:hypothetical protein